LDPVGISDTIAGYDQTAGEFAARWGSLRLERALKTFTDRLPAGAPERRRVLDLGCGPGRDLEFLEQLGCRTVGLDLSSGMLAQARLRVPRTPLVQADARHAPFAAGNFEGVWACASLLHLARSQLPAALREVRRLLHRPGGVLYLALKGGTGEDWVKVGDRRAFFAYYQPHEIKTALARAGFHVAQHWVVADRAGRRHPWINVIADVARA
jgi:SAM-dependent methyltransferase